MDLKEAVQAAAPVVIPRTCLNQAQRLWRARSFVTHLGERIAPFNCLAARSLSASSYRRSKIELRRYM